MIPVPQEFADALQAAGLANFFADCTNAHRKEYLKWIGEARRLETRQARVKKAVQMLAEKYAKEATKGTKRRYTANSAAFKNHFDGAGRAGTG